MEEQPQCNTMAPTKETTKFENLSNEICRTPSLINQIFQTVYNIEDRLGETNEPDKADCEKKEEPTSVIAKNTIKVQDVNDDLISIQDRLINIQKLF